MCQSLYTSFLQLVSAHSRLVHMCTGRLYAEGITALIENSPELLTCHIYAYMQAGS